MRAVLGAVALQETHGETGTSSDGDEVGTLCTQPMTGCWGLAMRESVVSQVSRSTSVQYCTTDY